MWWWCWWCRVPWLCVYGDPGMAWTCVGGGCWLGCLVRVLWYGGGGRRWWGRCCWCAPEVWAWGGVSWLVRALVGAPRPAGGRAGGLPTCLGLLGLVDVRGG